MESNYYIGLDIGSTSIKAVVLDSNYTILWKRYERHETRQAEKALKFLSDIEVQFRNNLKDLKLYLTGSGGNNLAEVLSSKYIQEVNAISFAVEKFLPNARSVIELGGQDAKIILFIQDEKTGRVKKIATMNDKCAGGTGSVIDKIAAKLKILPEKISELKYNNLKIHRVAGKCGVFAETDINSLQKQGIPSDELMASLFESIVQQNLSVLTRGYTLRPEIVLLGGPNTFIQGMHESWKSNIMKLWSERNFILSNFKSINDIIFVPKNAQYFAAIGAILFGKNFETHSYYYKGKESLEDYILRDRDHYKIKNSTTFKIEPLFEGIAEFKQKYNIPPFIPGKFLEKEQAELFVGIDCGSTSSKAVLLNKNREIVEKYYQISNGNPIDDVKEIFKNLQQKIEANGATLSILGVGVTGYAKNIIKDAISSDVALVETIAHANAAKHYYKNVDVICDVGGQDIKIIILRDGRVADFKLNTQCSAGNGYFLHNTAESFGYAINDYAEKAFSVKEYPEFGYGCAIFLQSDIVNFQRQGWTRDEILAGLACVLPKNIWLYVSQIPNITSLGTTFILQGGTQYNLAAAKAQIDFIKAKFKEKNLEPNIIIHKHAGECGAIGAGLEAIRIYESGTVTKFIGLDKVKMIRYNTYRDDRTFCNFCKNKCIRTYIDISTSNIVEHLAGDNFPYKRGAELTKAGRLESTELTLPKKRHDRIDINPGDTRLIIATCEKGTVEDINDMRNIQREINVIKQHNPNLLEYSSNIIWKSFNSQVINENLINKILYSKRANNKLLNKRSKIVIGIPRVLNLYQYAPFFTSYFESLGIIHSNIIFSDFTSERLYREGVKRGSIDPCFPSKITLAHVHNLLYDQNSKRKINIIFFPMVDTIPSELKNTVDHRSCPAGVATPEVVKAAFTKETNIFSEFNVKYINPFINLNEPELCEAQLYFSLKELLSLSKDENTFALNEGYEALKRYNLLMQQKGKELLVKLEYEDRIGIVIIARPYHNDIGLNHGIPEEFQKLGYPILTQDSLPTDTETLHKVFHEDLVRGIITDPLEINDVWKNSFSENTNKKLWAAKFIARHPNLVALELSNFKCGHDAPIYSVVRQIIEKSGTPFFTFRDIDENKPVGSIKIRIETIDYFLKRFQEYRYLQKQISNSISNELIENEINIRHELEKA